MKKHVFPLLIIVITLLIWLITYQKLPAELPTHWNFNGEVDGYSPKLNAMLMQMGIMILLYVSVAFLPKIDPRKANYKYFSKSYGMILNSLLVIFFVLNLLVILGGIGYDIPMGSLGTVIIGVIFIVIGNFMQQVKSNFFMGIRTPWTLSNEEVWRKTHRFSGKIFFVAGIVLILTTFLPEDWKSSIVITIIVIVIAAPYVYSYLQYKKQQ